MNFIPTAGNAIVPILLVFIAATLIALALTPVVRRVVIRYEIVDRPEARRVNVIPVPRGGGLAVCAAFLIVAVAFLAINLVTNTVFVPFTLEEPEMAAQVFVLDAGSDAE